MIEFPSSTNSVETSPVIWILFASLVTIILSSLLVLTYDKTSRKVSRPDNFVQSLILMSLVTCTIMQSIGDSLALGFGIFGALAIIRFRTRISDPRDVAFVFATMAVGIACGVHSFLNGAIGTVIFCVMAVLLRFTPFGAKSRLIGNLRVLTLPDDDEIIPVLDILTRYTDDHSIKRIRAIQTLGEEERTEYELTLMLKNDVKVIDFISDVRAITNVHVSRLVFDDQNDQDNS
jgi:uncharacterized membrane protein YhiD involved in acid resistance